jgi:hypothetical protein
MNYEKIYERLIEKARNRMLAKPYETHHIIPKCMGGSNDDANKVRLTPEEHYLAHLLLVKLNPKNSKLIFAANMMTVSKPKMPRNNKSYGWLKKKVAETLIGKPLADSTKQKISAKRKGKATIPQLSWDQLAYSTQCKLYRKKSNRVPEGWTPNYVRGTAENLQKMSNVQKGKKLSAETKQKIGIASKNSWNETRKKNQSEKIKGIRSVKYWSTKQTNLIV